MSEDEIENDEPQDRDDEPSYDADALYDQMVEDDFFRLEKAAEEAVAAIRKKNEARPWFGYYSNRDEAKAWEDLMVICDSKLEQLKGQLPLGLVRRRDIPVELR